MDLLEFTMELDILTLFELGKYHVNFNWIRYFTQVKNAKLIHTILCLWKKP